ncbi:MAG: hypothetical protein PHN69_04155 [Candidatus Pacebacteria bacterium]|nr:hypothetical protein [Candidatus Paceibacterota bacterium]
MDKVKKVREINEEVTEESKVVDEILPKELLTFNVGNFDKLEMYKRRFKVRYNVDFISKNDKVAIFEGKQYRLELRIG